MSNTRWHSIEELFHAALPLRPVERTAFLQARCAGDSALLHEVEALIAHSETASPLDEPLPRPTQSTAPVRRRDPGDEIGSFRILEHLGAGGMGQVYKALDKRLGRTVALKFISAPTPAQLERFKLEAHTISALNHPHIVTMHDFLETGGECFLVTEFIEGETVRKRLQGGPAPLPEVLRVALQAASALRAAHQAGVIHRDIKPENIMIRKDGYVKVLDFGIAKTTAPSETGSAAAAYTAEGMVIGTPAYMSPEQLRGEALDARTDIWSLGVVLHEMCFGALPSHRPAGSRVPAAMESVLARALAADRDKRYRDVEEMIRDLDLAANALPRSGTGARRLTRVLRWAAAASVIAIAVSAVYYLLPSKDRIYITKMVRITTNGNAFWAAISPDGHYLGYVKGQPGDQSLWVRQIDSETERQLTASSSDNFVGITFSPDSTSIYYVARGATTVANLYRISILGEDRRLVVEDVDSPVAFSPRGDAIAFVRDSPQTSSSALIVGKIDGTSQRVVAETKNPEHFSYGGPAWSSDERTLAAPMTVQANGRVAATIVSVDVGSGKRRVLSDEKSWIGRVAWLPGGGGIAAPVSDDDSSPAHLAVLRRGKLELLTTDLSDFYDVTVSAGALRIAAIQQDRRSYVSVAALSPWDETKLTAGAGRYEGISWAGHDSLLTSTASPGAESLWLVQPSTRKLSRVTSEPVTAIGPTACGERDFVLSVLRDGRRNLWQIGGDGRNLRQLTTGPGPDISPQCTSDGETVVYASASSGVFTIWSVPRQGGRPVQLTHRLSRSPAISPDGKVIACEYNSEQPRFQWEIAIVPIAGGEPVRMLNSVPARSMFRWSPDGRAITYIRTVNGVSNIWRQELAGGAAVPITRFTNDVIFAFDWSSDGRRIALTRGAPVNDAVLVEYSKY